MTSYQLFQEPEEACLVFLDTDIYINQTDMFTILYFPITGFHVIKIFLNNVGLSNLCLFEYLRRNLVQLTCDAAHTEREPFSTSQTGCYSHVEMVYIEHNPY